MTHELHELHSEVERLRTVLRQARAFVANAGDDEDPEAQRYAIATLADIDDVLK